MAPHHVQTRRGRARFAATLATAILLLGACGDDEDVDDARQDAEGLVNQSAVRVQAEAFRGLLKTKGDGDAVKYVSMTVLQDALDDLPGDVTSSGLADTNNDGRDDDGRVQLEVNGEKACVSITGTDTTVSNGACA